MARGTTPKQVEIADRRAKVSEMYVTGKTQEEIAFELEVDQATVSRDLKALQAEWMQSAISRIDRAKGEELRKIDRLEREYWDAWKRSVGKKHEWQETKKKVARYGKNEGEDQVVRGEGATRETESDLLGDPRYLQGVQWCIERRCKILGVDPGGKNTLLNLDLSKLTYEQLTRIAGGEDPIHVLATSRPGGTGTETTFSD